MFQAGQHKEEFQRQVENGTCQNSKEIPVAREEHGGGDHLEMRGVRREGDWGWVHKGFSSQMKHPFVCGYDPVELQISFLLLYLRTATHQEITWLFKNQMIVN